MPVLLLYLFTLLKITVSIVDDDLYSPTIPFCRQGHSQSTLFSKQMGSTTTEKIIVFGGRGINYKRPGSRYFDDLWELKINESSLYRYSKTFNYDFQWKETKRIDLKPWPSKRWNFAHTVIRDEIHDKLLIFGGEHDLVDCNRMFAPPFSTSTTISKELVLGDMWLLINSTNWIKVSNGWPSPDCSSFSGSRKLQTSQNVELHSELPRNLYMQLPGPRKGSQLVTLPTTNSVLLLGGYGSTILPKEVNSKINSHVSTENSIRNSYVPDRETQKYTNSNSDLTGNADDMNEYAIKRRCLVDFYALNMTNILEVATSSSSSTNDETSLWRRLGDFPVSSNNSSNNNNNSVVYE